MLFPSKSFLALAALLAGGLLLGACGGNSSTSSTPTTTPSNTLGTDSAATKVGGTMPATPADSAGTGH